MARRRKDDRTNDLFAYADDNRPAIVYLATNTISGNQYVGITRKSLEKRKAQHIDSAKYGTKRYFHRAISKHGADAFHFETIVQCASYADAKKEEQRQIALLKPKYNMTLGGDGLLGYRPNAETRLKMSQSAKLRPSPWIGKKHSPESIAKRTATRARNQVRPWLGKKRPKETVDRLVASATWRRKWVKCLTDGKVYHGLRAAGEAYGIKRYKEIAHACSGKVKTIRGLRFEYVAGGQT